MKMPDKVEENMIAPCGVNCMACSAHLGDKNPCPGCRASTDQITRKSCQNCAKKKCAFEKGLQWCFQCGKFPCARVRSLNQRYTQSYNVNLIQNGLDAKQNMVVFLQTQKEQFTCAACGGVIDQHHRRCSECGNNYNQEKKGNVK